MIIIIKQRVASLWSSFQIAMRGPVMIQSNINYFNRPSVNYELQWQWNLFFVENLFSLAVAIEHTYIYIIHSANVALE